MFPDAGFGSLSLSPLGVFSSAWENGRTDGGGSHGTARDGGLCRTARQTTGKRRCNFSLGQRQSWSRLRAILQLLKGGGEQSGSREQRGVSREEERQARQVGGPGTRLEKEPPWWCASLPAAGGAGSTNNYLTIFEPGNKQSLASTTTTKEMTTPKSKT